MRVTALPRYDGATPCASEWEYPLSGNEKRHKLTKSPRGNEHRYSQEEHRRNKIQEANEKKINLYLKKWPLLSRSL